MRFSLSSVLYPPSGIAVLGGFGWQHGTNRCALNSLEVARVAIASSGSLMDWCLPSLLPFPVSDSSACVLVESELFIVGSCWRSSSCWKVDIAALLRSSTPAWTQLASIPDRREHFAFAVIKNNLLLLAGGKGAGGFHHQPQQPSNYFCTLGYSFPKDCWLELASLKHPDRAYCCGAALPASSSVAVGDDSMIVIGGLADGSSLSSCERYDVKCDAWSFIAPMHQCRSSACCVALPPEHHGDVMVLGGHNGESGELTSVEIYHSDKDEWTCAPSLLHPVEESAAVVLSDHVYVIGGGANQATAADCLVFDLTVHRDNNNSDSWHSLPNRLNIPRYGHCAFSFYDPDFE